MTSNQIAYAQHLEDIRSNKAQEAQKVNELAETHEHNVGIRTETERTNKAKEAETNRANLAKERETYRTNLSNEQIKWNNLSEDRRHNVETEKNAILTRLQNKEIADADRDAREVIEARKDETNMYKVNLPYDFESVGEQNKRQIDAINALVKVADIIWPFK